MLVEAFPFKKNCGLRYCRKNLYTYILNVKIVGQICPTLFLFATLTAGAGPGR